MTQMTQSAVGLTIWLASCRNNCHVCFGSKADIAEYKANVRFVPKAGVASLNRWSRRPRCLGDYSREDAKSCNAIPAKRFFSATQIRQKRLTSAICWSGTWFLWHRFWAHCELH